MSDLQIALAALGILVIGAVYAFNLWQERKLRRRLESAFGGDRDDVLLKSSGTHDARIEPRLNDGIDEAAPAVATARWQAAPAADSAPDGADRDIEYVATIELKSPVGAGVLHELQSRLSTFGKPARLLGWDAGAATWRVLGRDAETGCTRLQAALLLANRAGPVHAPQLGGFCDAVRAWAVHHEGTVDAGEPADALEAARELDAFCGNVDIAIGLNVVAQPGSAFSGEQVAAAATAAGFVLEADGLFHRQDADGRTLFTMENHETEPFAVDRLEGMQTPGLTLLLDVPRIAEGEAALDEMARTCDALAGALGGFVVDDNRVALQAAGIERIKLQLREIHRTMAAHDIPAGGSRAQRLFA